MFWAIRLISVILGKPFADVAFLLLQLTLQYQNILGYSFGFILWRFSFFNNHANNLNYLLLILCFRSWLLNTCILSLFNLVSCVPSMPRLTVSHYKSALRNVWSIINLHVCIARPMAKLRFLHTIDVNKYILRDRN